MVDEKSLEYGLSKQKLTFINFKNTINNRMNFNKEVKINSSSNPFGLKDIMFEG